MIAVKRFGLAFFQSRKRELEFKVLLKNSNIHQFSILVPAFSIICAIKLFHFKMIPLFNITWIDTIYTYHRRVAPVSLVSSVYFVHEIIYFFERNNKAFHGEK